MDSIKVVKRIAHTYVDDLDRPGRMSRTEWLRVKTLLHAIVNYLPTPYPGQPRLARDTEMSQRSVRRYVALALEYNLLEVRPDCGVFRSTHNPSRTNYYHIIGLEHMIPSLETMLTVDEANLAPSDEANLAPKEDSDTYVSTSSTQSTENPSGSPQEGAASAAHRVRRLTVPKRNLSEALAKAEARGKRPAKTKRREWDPSRRLMNRFLDVCTELDLPSDVRVFDSVGQVTGYIRATFIDPPAGRRYTPEEVEKLIEQWALDVRRLRIQIKPGQSAFQSFAGNWGRSTGPRVSNNPQPGASYRERYRQQRGVDER